MLKGTQVLIGKDASEYRRICSRLYLNVSTKGYSEVILPSIWNAQTFEDKISGDTKEQMWKFKDKADRDVCLIPEVTGIIQEMYNSNWSKELKKPIKIFYLNRCYRYERPQLGRLREFTQFGVELLTDKVSETDDLEVRNLLKNCLDDIPLKGYVFKDSVQRGLGYYTSNGFEVECDSLGAQKQIAGGGRYKEGIGWAIGIERLQLALR